MKRIALFSCLFLAAAACEDSKDKDKTKGASESASGNVDVLSKKKAATPGDKPKVAVAPPKAADTWTTYTNAKLGFTVETPRKPRTGKQRVNTEAGMVTANTLTFSRPGANGMIAIWVTPMPFPKGHKPDPNKMFDGAVTNALKVVSGKVDSQKNLTINGVPGREVEASGTMKGRKVGAYFRMFYQGVTLYQVMSIFLGSEKRMLKEAHRLIRSFKPIAGGAPKLASGVDQVEISGIQVKAQKIGFGKKKGNYYLPIKFTVNVKKPLGARDKVRVHTWCRIGGDLKAVSSQARSTDMKKVLGGGTVETKAAPFILKPLTQEPTVCQMSFKLRTGLDDKANLGDYCWSSGKVAKGSCAN